MIFLDRSQERIMTLIEIKSNLQVIDVAVTVAVPNPEEMCEYVLWYCTSLPKYLIEVISQLLLLTETIKAFAAPVSIV